MILLDIISIEPSDRGLSSEEISDLKEEIHQFKSIINTLEEKTYKEEEALEFAEWVYNNRWFYFNEGNWHYTFEGGTTISKKAYKKNYIKTTAQLFQLFLKERENE